MILYMIHVFENDKLEKSKKYFKCLFTIHTNILNGVILKVLQNFISMSKT